MGKYLQVSITYFDAITKEGNLVKKGNFNVKFCKTKRKLMPISIMGVKFWILNYMQMFAMLK